MASVTLESLTVQLPLAEQLDAGRSHMYVAEFDRLEQQARDESGEGG